MGDLFIVDVNPTDVVAERDLDHEFPRQIHGAWLCLDLVIVLFWKIQLCDKRLGNSLA